MAATFLFANAPDAAFHGTCGHAALSLARIGGGGQVTLFPPSLVIP
jgi:hypothetical protein